MKKRYMAGLALALVGILSVCGQPAADNTISLTPVEETTADQSGRLIEYNFSGHRSEAEGVLFGCYIWDGSTWQKDEDATFGLRCSATLGSGKGTIKFERDGDAANANYKIGMDSPQLGGYAFAREKQSADGGIDGNCCCMGGTCQWLGSRHGNSVARACVPHGRYDHSGIY